MSMNALLDELYGTSKTAHAQPTSTEEEKAAEAAQVQLFLKVAADQGIDVNALPREHVEQLWGNFQTNLAKLAEAQAAPPSEDEEKKRKAEAEKEHAEKKAALAEETAKLASYDFYGRVMAHSYLNELNAALNGGAINKEAQAVAIGKAPAEAPEGKKDEPKPEDKKSEEEKAAAYIHALAKAASEHVKLHREKVAAAGGPKTDSAIDELAAGTAVMKVAQYIASAPDATPVQVALAAQEAAEKVAAAETLNAFLPASQKVASAQNTDTAIDWRACEMLESVGYPITWPQ